MLIFNVFFLLNSLLSRYMCVNNMFFSFFQGFYLYLYGLSIGYLFFMYCFILRERKEHKQVSFKNKFVLCFKSFKKTEHSVEQSDDCSSHHSSMRSINQSSKLSRTDESQEYTYCYLRLGVVGKSLWFIHNAKSLFIYLLYFIPTNERHVNDYIKCHYSLILNSKILLIRPPKRD